MCPLKLRFTDPRSFGICGKCLGTLLHCGGHHSVDMYFSTGQVDIKTDLADFFVVVVAYFPKIWVAKLVTLHSMQSQLVGFGTLDCNSVAPRTIAGMYASVVTWGGIDFRASYQWSGVYYCLDSHFEIMLYILCFQFLLQKISYVVNRNKVMDVQDAAINCCEETKHELQCCGYVLRKGKELVFYVQQNASITCHHFAAIVNFILYLQHFMLCSHSLDFFFRVYFISVMMWFVFA